MPGTVLSFIILLKCYNKYARKVLLSLFRTEKPKFRHTRELAQGHKISKCIYQLGVRTLTHFYLTLRFRAILKGLRWILQAGLLVFQVQYSQYNHHQTAGVSGIFASNFLTMNCDEVLAPTCCWIWVGEDLYPQLYSLAFQGYICSRDSLNSPSDVSQL